MVKKYFYADKKYFYSKEKYFFANKKYFYDSKKYLQKTGLFAGEWKYDKSYVEE